MRPLGISTPDPDRGAREYGERTDEAVEADPVMALADHREVAWDSSQSSRQTDPRMGATSFHYRICRR